jgi:predicted nuclease with TOPRIM domain
MLSRKNFGDDLLVSTSVHLRVGTLKQLRELFPKKGSSRFIREAVEEKLRRDGGLQSTIERLAGEREAVASRLHSIDEQLKQLTVDAMKLDMLNLEGQRRKLISEALINVSYATVEDVFKDLNPILKIADKKDETFVKALIDEEWGKHHATT